jgi:hypothetical protein
LMIFLITMNLIPFYGPTYPIFTNLILHHVKKLSYNFTFFWLSGSWDFKQFFL